MTKLFAESIQIDKERSVSVTELSDHSVGIMGVTTRPYEDAKTRSIRFSPEAAEEVRQILNRWHRKNKVKKD